MAVIERSNVIEGGRSRDVRRSATYEYDFAREGGAVGTINLFPIDGPSQLPSGAVIIDAIVEVLTVPTSGGAATLGLDSEAAGDIVATATLISAQPWATVGRKAGVPVSAATSVKTTAARTPATRVGVAALTAGKFRVTLEYLVSA